MKVLYNWLKEFVDVEAPAAEVRARLSAVGLSTEGLEDTPAGPMLDIDLTTNRPDCLGHYGVARELAAILRVPLKRVDPKLRETSERADTATRVDIEAPDLCGRFTARVIRGVKVQPSPDWLRLRLDALGHASINNVVDATNYVMLELGHPLHAFDLDTLAEQRIVVRRPRAGEARFRTLDGQERRLSGAMCMVCDAVRPTGVGGVMGGLETEISFSTRNVLLECAWFEPVPLRRTARALGLRTEASLRFERGMDPEMAEVASRRCAELIQQLAGGEILAGVVDTYPRKPERPRIELTRKEILRIMGADVPDKDVDEILSSLGFEPQRTDGARGSKDSLMATWDCRRPTWRHDVTREIDLIEEVARHYGFDRFPARLPVAQRPAARLPHAEAEDAIRQRLMALGFEEAISIPLVDPHLDELFRAPAGENITPVRLGNPLAEDASILRTSGLVNMLHALEWNINRGQHHVRLFEIGKKYHLDGVTPVETPILTFGATGLAREKSVHESPRAFSFADLKGVLDSLGVLIGGFVWAMDGEHALPSWLHPAHSGVILAARAVPLPPSGTRDLGPSSPQPLGVAGHIPRKIADRCKLRQDVFVAELLLEPLFAAYAAARAAVRFAPIPKFPAVERDFSLLLPDGTTFAWVAAAIRELSIADVRRIEAVDLFRGGNIPAGKYSLLVRVTFQSDEATFTDAQLADFSARIIATLESRLGATLRA
jgi:phenylalanyl-tRNA synthetase beta chain